MKDHRLMEMSARKVPEGFELGVCRSGRPKTSKERRL